MKIGSINLPHITVADDLAVFARTYSTQQVKIWDAEFNTNRERYCVNPVKSSTLYYPFGRTHENEIPDIRMAEDKISNDSSTTHLGIHREISDKPNIEEKTSIGRKTAYSLMGAGFHSGNGLKVSLNGFIWSTFVVPTITYGLQVLILRKKDTDLLEKFQRKSLKQIQGLPDKTPNVVTLSSLGIPPIESVIHKSALNLFMNIVREKETVEYKIAERQLAMKNTNEKGWFNYIRTILEMYNMPSIFSLFEQQIPESEWKLFLNQSINSVVEAAWKCEIESKSRKEDPQKLTQLSSRSHPRHLVGKRTSQKDITIDTTSASQVNSYFPNRWSPTSLTFNNYFHLFLYLYLT